MERSEWLKHMQKRAEELGLHALLVSVVEEVHTYILTRQRLNQSSNGLRTTFDPRLSDCYPLARNNT